MTADETTLVATVQGQLQDAMNFEGSSKEKQVRALMATIGLDYDTLTKKSLSPIISGLKKSKYLKKSHQPARKSTTAATTRKGQKETQSKEKSAPAFEACADFNSYYNALEFFGKSGVSLA